MMKRFLLIIFFLVISHEILYSQNTEMYAEVIVKDIHRKSQDSIQFEVVLKRLSEDWNYFANCTFHLTFDTTQFQFNNSNFGIKRDSSGLVEGIVTGNNNPLGGYSFSEKIIRNKIVISILCPETIEESQLMNLNDEFVLGKYTVFSLDNTTIPLDIRWNSPINYYQKAAYKLEKDSIRYSVKLFDKNDNLDFISKKKTKLAFRETYLPYGDTIVLVNFVADYVGQKKIELSWNTKEELNVVGYTIKRAIRLSSLEDSTKLNYETIYTWRNDTTKKYHPEMLSKGNTKTGFAYGLLPDTVLFRGVEYCYQLFCSFYDSLKNPIDKDVFLAHTCEAVPNALIIRAQIISENPYDDEITIEFQLADDCLLSIGSYDLNGKLVERLKDKQTKEEYNRKKMGVGTYQVTFDPLPPVASASYYIYLIAYPLNDETMDESKVVIKIMNMK